MTEFRFAAVISHPIQHYSPVFRALARVPGVAVKVFYFCDHGVRESFDQGFGQAFKWDVPLLDGYAYESRLGAELGATPAAQALMRGFLQRRPG